MPAKKSNSKPRRKSQHIPSSNHKEEVKTIVQAHEQMTWNIHQAKSVLRLMENLAGDEQGEIMVDAPSLRVTLWLCQDLLAEAQRFGEMLPSGSTE